MTGCGVLTKHSIGAESEGGTEKSSVVPSLTVRVSTWLNAPLRLRKMQTLPCEVWPSTSGHRKRRTFTAFRIAFYLLARGAFGRLY